MYSVHAHPVLPTQLVISWGAIMTSPDELIPSSRQFDTLPQADNSSRTHLTNTLTH